MVYTPNTEKKHEARLTRQMYEKEEQKRHKQNKIAFSKWQLLNPGKGLMTYIMNP